MSSADTRGLRVSLRVKIALALVLVTTISVVFIAFQARQVLTQFAEDRRQVRVDELIEFVGTTSVTALLSSDFATIDDLASQLASRSDVNLIAVANESHRVIASSNHELAGTPIEDIVPKPDTEVRRKELVLPGLPDAVGYAYIEVNRDALVAAQESLNRTMLMFGVLAVFFSLVVGVVLSRQMTRGLNGVVTSAQSIASGDLTTAAPAPSNDETGDLSMSFEAMREALIRLVSRSRDGVGAIRAAMRATTEVAAANRQVTEQVSASTQRAVTAVQQLNTITERTRERAEMMVALSETSETAVNRGLSAADSSILQMEELVEQIAGLSRLTQQLAEGMQRVERVNATVTELARQAHLVSVNARLEATRAAEAGRTFSEVAGQMRSLADNSRDGARRVQDLLGEIQRSFANVVQTVGAAQKRAGKAGDVAADARRALDNMVGALKEFGGAARSIATATQEQQAGTRELMQSSNEIRVAVDAMLKSFQDMSSAVTRVDAFSGDLSQIVGSYRVPEANSGSAPSSPQV